MSNTTEHAPAPARKRMSGLGRVLVVVYGILALAALGRSVFQIIDRFGEAPLAFTLSAVSAVVYAVATIALAARWDRVAWVTIGFELLGVLVVGTISVVVPGSFGDPNGATYWDMVNPFSGTAGRIATVWSVYGLGYFCIPLVLPVLGMLWLRTSSRTVAERARRDDAPISAGAQDPA